MVEIRTAAKEGRVNGEIIRLTFSGLGKSSFDAKFNRAYHILEKDLFIWHMHVNVWLQFTH